ncbi:MAG: nonribosomal peptide synthetase MxaA [Methylotenera sp.]|nr:nonribosomal peptide synthetase MxaA [Methylotenera sp.]
MKNLIIKWSALLGMLLLVTTAIAQESTVAMAKILRVTNPSQSNNIQVGDVLTRTIELEVQAPYQLSQQALPMKGANYHGIELTDIQLNTSTTKQSTHYIIDLRYQVFAAEFVPAVLQLPAEKFALTGGSEALTVNLPAWQFWFSPMVPKVINNAKENMYPQFKPTLIDLAAHQIRLALWLGLFLVGLIGWVYINADKRWLPFMNGAFAAAHRKLKKLAKNQVGEKQALVYMHQAFNQVHGNNLFVNELDEFLTAHPVFAKYKAEIAAFFERSNQSLFADQHQNSEQLIAEFIGLSRDLRNCERGV